MTNETQDFRDATILIIGGSGGIGGALSRILIPAGARVVATGRDPDRLQALADEVGCETRVLDDAADFDAVEALVGELAGRERGLAGAVNCAGSILLKPAHLTTRADLDQTLQQNLHTAFALVRAAGRHMTEGGSIVLFSTAAVRIGLTAHEAIAAAKGAVEGLTRAAATTYSGRGLRVNAVAPGLVDTPLSSRILGNEAGRKASLALHPLGRLGEPSDVARVAAFLLDPANDWMTGQVIGVDGGLSTLRPRG